MAAGSGDTAGTWHRSARVLADVVRAAALASLLAAVLWYPQEAWLRFGLLTLILLLPRWVKLPAAFDAAFCATLLLATWANVAAWYRSVVWMDEVVHFLTVGAVSAAAYLALAHLRLLPAPQEPPVRTHRASLAILTVSLGLAVASLWEFYEWVAYHLPHDAVQIGYDDTILDLALGGLGSLVAGFALAGWAAAGRGVRLATGSRPQEHHVRASRAARPSPSR